MQGNKLSSQEVWLYHYSVYLPSVTYPLSNSFFSKAELDQFERPSINAVPSKTRMCNKTHLTIIYCPKGLGVRAYQSSYGNQDTLQLKQVLLHSRRKTQGGELMFIALQWAQFNARASVPLLEASTICEYLEVKWIKSLHKFLVCNKMKVWYYDSYVMLLQRPNDQYIMDLEMQLKMFTKRQLH